MIKNLMFDLIGPLLSNGNKTILNNPKQIGIKKNIIEDILFGEEIKKSKRGLITPKKYWGDLISKHSLKIKATELARRFYSTYKLKKGMINFIENLKDKHLIIASNNMVDRVSFIDKKFNFRNLFDKDFFSYNLGFVKSNPKFFEKVIKSGIKPNETILIDDKIQNIKVAKRLGFKCVHYKNQNQTIKEIRELCVD